MLSAFLLRFVSSLFASYLMQLLALETTYITITSSIVTPFIKWCIIQFLVFFRQILYYSTINTPRLLLPTRQDQAGKESEWPRCSHLVLNILIKITKVFLAFSWAKVYLHYSSDISLVAHHNRMKLQFYHKHSSCDLTLHPKAYHPRQRRRK